MYNQLSIDDNNKEQKDEMETEVWTVETVPMVHLQDSLYYVSDPEDLIEPYYQEKCDSLMRTLDNIFGVESAVIVVKQIKGDISQFATDLSNHYAIGVKNRGLCIVLAYEQHQLRIETGLTLESELPDSVCGKLMETCSLPYLMDKNPSIAIYNLCHGIVDFFSTQQKNTTHRQRRERQDNVDFFGAQQQTTTNDASHAMPQFPGGSTALMQWINKNINYPKDAAEKGIQGRVVVEFVVEKDGSITEVNVIRAVNPSLDKEAQRVVKSMPNWIPGKQNGKPVRVKYTIPITFRL